MGYVDPFDWDEYDDRYRHIEDDDPYGDDYPDAECWCVDCDCHSLFIRCSECGGIHS
jgi:hypothetical protein